MSRSRKLRRAVARGTITTAAGLLAGIAWLAAPALSTRPYVPKPVDFELSDRTLRLERTLAGASARLGTHGGEREGATSRDVHILRSGVIDAPKRFNVVGFRWRGRSDAVLSVRVRRDGGSWSAWVRVPVEDDHAPDAGSAEAGRRATLSDPLWAGEADEVQYRVATPGTVRGVRLHFVNSRGTATAPERARSMLRRTVSAAVGRLASLAGAKASADTSQPEIVTREQWGASSCAPRAAPSYGEVRLAFIHHTVTANDYGPEDSAAMVLGICRYHRNSNRWNDIGYQFLVDRYGKIFEGRAGGVDQAVVGAQAQGYNSQSTGISSLGTFSTSGQSEEGLGALTRLLSWKLALHGVAPQSKVVVRSAGGPLNRYPAGADVQLDAISGHRDGDATACPGDGLYAQLPRLRQMVSPDARAATRLDLRVQRQRIPYGRKARLSGLLTGLDGSPLPGRLVALRTISFSGATRKLTATPTDGAGFFGLNVRLVFNRTLLADFTGDGALRPSASRRLNVGVRPLVTAALAPLAAATRVPAGRRVTVTGSVRPRKRTALLIVDRRSSTGDYRRVLKRKLRVRKGKTIASYRLAKPGGYRLRLGVDADGRNLSARSKPIEVIAE